MTNPPRTWALAARWVLGWLLLALALLGHTVILFVGAVDALFTAAIGTRRVGLLARQLSGAVRETWREGLR